MHVMYRAFFVSRNAATRCCLHADISHLTVETAAGRYVTRLGASNDARVG